MTIAQVVLTQTQWTPPNPIRLNETSPNPVRAMLTLEYEIIVSGNYKIYASHMQSSHSILLVEGNDPNLVGAVIKYINTQAWDEGMYAIFIQHEGTLYNSDHKILKQNP